MPLTKSSVGVSEIPHKVYQMLEEVLCKVNAIHFRLDSITAEHEFIKKQMNAVEGKLDWWKTDFQSLRLELADATKNVKDVCCTLENTKVGYDSLRKEIINTTSDIESIWNVIKEDCQTAVNILKEAYQVLMTVAEISSDVKDFNSKLGTITAQQEVLKEQIRTVDSKLDCQKADHQALQMELADTTGSVKALDYKENLEVLKREVEVITRNVQAMENRQKMSTECIEKLTELSNRLKTMVDSQTMLRTEMDMEKDKIQKKVQKYSGTSDWNALKWGLELLLDHESEAYHQLQSIPHDDVVPLWRIGTRGHVKLATLLLYSGLPVKMTTTYGNSMLHGAAEKGHLHLVMLLVNLGADVNVRGASTNTPLIWAACRGHLQVVEFLVRSGADTRVRNKDGFTALQCAETSGHTNVVQYLVSHQQL